MLMRLLLEGIGLCVLFGVAWAICVRVKNYSFLVVVWTLSIGLLALADAVYGTGSVMRRVMFCGLGIAWSLRLGLFVLLRVLRHHPTEDKRYRSLRERWPTPLTFLGFFELQAAVALVFSLPFLVASCAADARMSLLEWLGLTIAAGGIVGEAVADHQSERFKRRQGGRQEVLDVGLWRYSRHPNYFFEIMSWVGFAVAALPLPDGWLAIACPMLISYFLLRVTGVPLTEKHSLETHGEAYRAYQRKTNAIFPGPPR